MIRHPQISKNANMAHVGILSHVDSTIFMLVLAIGQQYSL